MKKLVLLLLSSVCALNSFGQLPKLLNVTNEFIMTEHLFADQFGNTDQLRDYMGNHYTYDRAETLYKGSNWRYKDATGRSSNTAYGSAAVALGEEPEVDLEFVAGGIGRVSLIRQNYWSFNDPNKNIRIKAADDAVITGVNADGFQTYSANSMPSDAIIFANWYANSSRAPERVGNVRVDGGIWHTRDAIHELRAESGFGRGAYQAGYFKGVGTLELYGASFIAGSGSGLQNGYRNNLGGNGLLVVDVTSLTLTNSSTDTNRVIRGGDSGGVRMDSLQDAVVRVSGGEGAYIFESASKVTIKEAEMYGGGNVDPLNPRQVTLYGETTAKNTVRADGGNALVINTVSAGGISIDGEANYFEAGDGADVDANGPDLEVYAMGGHAFHGKGIVGITSITNGRFVAGNANRSIIQSSNLMGNSNGSNYLFGGDGIRLESVEDVTVADVDAIAGHAGAATIINGSNSYANASGGSGLYVDDGRVITVNGGSYQGKRGGTANVSMLDSNNEAIADGGSGVYVQNSSRLNINGGLFSGGAAGAASGPVSSARPGFGVTAINTDLIVSNSYSDTIINDGIYFSSTGSQNLEISGGTVNGGMVVNGPTVNMDLLAGSIIGDIEVVDSSITMTVDNDEATYDGSFLIDDVSVVDVNLTASNQATFFSDVQIDGAMNFNGTHAVLANNANFNLTRSGSLLHFDGVDVSSGAKVNVGLGSLVSGGNLTVKNGGMLSFGYDGQNNTFGTLTFENSGQILEIELGGKIYVQGISSTPSGSLMLYDGVENTVIHAANNTDAVIADFGWLTKVENGDIDTNLVLTVNYSYNPLTNRTEFSGEVDDAILAAFDGYLDSPASSNLFYALNSKSVADGLETVALSLAKTPDTSYSVFQGQREVSDLLAERGNSFRQLNGLASAKNSFSARGAAGPGSRNKNSLTGWVKAYGGRASRDKDGLFSEYDASSWGTLVGIDKSFNSLLIGFAGGYGEANIDSEGVYEADVKMYHGSIYSTIGGESLYLDLSGTFGVNQAEMTEPLSSEDVDSTVASFYVGVGKKFSVSENIEITPQASVLGSYFSQDEYTRNLSWTNFNVDEYDEWSYVSSVGVDLATHYEFSFGKEGYELVPEFRFHCLSDLNAEDNSIAIKDDPNGSGLDLRSRDDLLFKVGIGFDLLNVNILNTKLELDYDALLGDTYRSHTVSGKLTYAF